MCELCDICGEPVYKDGAIYDGEVCHQKCALDDMDSIGMDFDE